MSSLGGIMPKYHSKTGLTLILMTGDLTLILTLTITSSSRNGGGSIISSIPAHMNFITDCREHIEEDSVESKPFWNQNRAGPDDVTHWTSSNRTWDGNNLSYAAWLQLCSPSDTQYFCRPVLTVISIPTRYFARCTIDFANRVQLSLPLGSPFESMDHLIDEDTFAIDSGSGRFNELKRTDSKIEHSKPPFSDSASKHTTCWIRRVSTSRWECLWIMIYCWSPTIHVLECIQISWLYGLSEVKYWIVSVS